jgi:hypothetical protein
VVDCIFYPICSWFVRVCYRYASYCTSVHCRDWRANYVWLNKFHIIGDMGLILQSMFLPVMIQIFFFSIQDPERQCKEVHLIVFKENKSHVLFVRHQRQVLPVNYLQTCWSFLILTMYLIDQRVENHFYFSMGIIVVWIYHFWNTYMVLDMSGCVA